MSRVRTLAPRMGSRPTIKYQPALDGVRALAVLAVLAFHAEVPGFSGGYLGVSVFFTLSGFLITSLLVNEAETTGRVSAGAFYARRARRLLPASVLCIGLIVVLAAVTDLFDGVADLRAHVVGSLLQVVNWVLALRRRLVPAVVPAGGGHRVAARALLVAVDRGAVLLAVAGRLPRPDAGRQDAPCADRRARCDHCTVRDLVTRDRRGVGRRRGVLGHTGTYGRDPHRRRAGARRHRSVGAAVVVDRGAGRAPRPGRIAW